jgi:hypothetical protein
LGAAEAISRNAASRIWTAHRAMFTAVRRSADVVGVARVWVLMSVVLSLKQRETVSRSGLVLTRRTRNGRIDTRAGIFSGEFFGRGVDPAVSRSTRTRRPGSDPARDRFEQAHRRRHAMRFLLMTTDDGSSAGNPPDEKLMREMGQFIEEMTKAGVLLATGGLDPNGIHIKSSGGEVTVTDGPFAEAKEAVVGFALIDVRSREEAIELSKRFWSIVGDGQGEIRQVFGP